MEKLLKYQNSKLRNQFIFNLPVSNTVCGRKCPGCYALKPQLRFPAVQAYRDRRYEASLQPNFVNRITSELTSTRRKFLSVRLHESGEFHSQPYIDKWVLIASQLPDIKFYAFTKRIADFDFSKLSSLPNFVLINSLHFGKLNYGNQTYLDSLPDTMTCPSTTTTDTVCGVSCNYCWTKQAQSNGIKFLQH